MGRVFIFTVSCMCVILILSGVIIWDSFYEGEKALYESEFLRVKTAETRENPNIGGPVEPAPDNEDFVPVDYQKMTPGLQELVREGKPNAEITVDRIR
ncbi:MAG: hypothetical protein BZY75_04830 [SAR202 cluster bacterium Io17-Chloro-G7]|nr:MAG: hypothetical protein BZY75_04830 [SAR202 cluster bacterium Io17-Chloro-G7]